MGMLSGVKHRKRKRKSENAMKIGLGGVRFDIAHVLDLSGRCRCASAFQTDLDSSYMIGIY